MYAVVRTGGKQYRVTRNDVITVEKLGGEVGETVELNEVLAMDKGEGPTIGEPLVEGARVTAEVVDQARGDKVVVFKKKRRKNYRRRRGHRQPVTVLRIGHILAEGETVPEEYLETVPAETNAQDAPVEEQEDAPVVEESPENDAEQ